MARYASPPPELQQAIDSSSARYGIPANVLVGIWEIESGSSYPNPYVNSSGYGGLFGTTDWQGSTQSQSDLAASILAKLLKRNKGDLSAALLQYSGGGYSSVPGQGGAGAQTTDPLGGSQYQAPPRPGTQDTSFGSDLLGALEIGSNPIGSFFSGIFGAGSTLDALKNFFGFVTFLFQPKNWLRLFEGIIGVLLILLGLWFLGSGDAGPDLGEITPAGLAGGAKEGASRNARAAASETTAAKTARSAAAAL